MHLIQALEKHIPIASLLLKEAPTETALSTEWKVDEATQVVCAFGLSGELYASVRNWLDEDSQRRLIFVEEEAGALAALLEHEDAILLLNDLRVKIYFLESPLQISALAKKVAWNAVFQEMSYLPLRKSENEKVFGQELKKCHFAAHLLLSDVSDWGLSLLQNAKSNAKHPARSGLELKGKFAGVPAVIVGAGHSLEKSRPQLKEWREKGLILAGGSALNLLDFPPHLAASVDKEAPYRQFKMHSFFETPFCFQSRMNRDNFAIVHGPSLLFPDGNAAWINWLNEQEELFDGGWTVGNFLTSVALLLGCNPILFVGMDFCYQKEQKYAALDSLSDFSLIQMKDRKGKSVWTQRDWAMAAEWMHGLPSRYPEREFYQIEDEGLCRFPLLSKDFSKGDFTKKLHEEIQKVPLSSSRRWEEWESSLLRCQLICNEVSTFDSGELEEEIAYHLLLKPLWDVWKSIFERELDLDLHPISREEKLELNRILFFQQVLQEHLNELL